MLRLITQQDLALSKSEWYQVKIENLNRLGSHQARTYKVLTASRELVKQLTTKIVPAWKNSPLSKSGCTSRNRR
jgi:hypothetical protein